MLYETGGTPSGARLVGKYLYVAGTHRLSIYDVSDPLAPALQSVTPIGPAFPNEDDEFNSCKYCPVNHSCRTKHDLDERYAMQQQRDPRTLLSGAP